jgi:transformation/transcription domain-associated protein
LYDHIQPVRTDLIQGLWRILSSPNDQLAQMAYRVLGKLGGSNRKMIIEPQKLEYNKNINNCKEFNGPTMKVSFPDYGANIEVSLEKVIQSCETILKPTTSTASKKHDLFYKKHAFKIVTSFMSSLIEPLLGNNDKHNIEELFKKFSSIKTTTPDSFSQKLLETCKFDDEHLRSMVELSFSCLFYASTIKEIESQVLPILDSFIVHFTLISLSHYHESKEKEQQQHQNQSDVESFGIQSKILITQNIQSDKNCLDFMILVDSLYAVLNNDNMDYWSIVERSIKIMIETSQLVTNISHNQQQQQQRDVNFKKRTHTNFINLALFDYLAEKICSLCYERSWFAKKAG